MRHVVKEPSDFCSQVNNVSRAIFIENNPRLRRTPFIAEIILYKNSPNIV